MSIILGIDMEQKMTFNKYGQGKLENFKLKFVTCII